VVAIGEEGFGVVGLDEAAGILHEHPMRHLGHHPHVMGDQHEPEARLALQIG